MKSYLKQCVLTSIVVLTTTIPFFTSNAYADPAGWQWAGEIITPPGLGLTKDLSVTMTSMEAIPDDITPQFDADKIILLAQHEDNDGTQELYYSFLIKKDDVSIPHQQSELRQVTNRDGSNINGSSDGRFRQTIHMNKQGTVLLNYENYTNAGSTRLAYRYGKLDCINGCLSANDLVINWDMSNPRFLDTAQNTRHNGHTIDGVLNDDNYAAILGTGANIGAFKNNNIIANYVRLEYNADNGTFEEAEELQSWSISGGYFAVANGTAQDVSAALLSDGRAVVLHHSMVNNRLYYDIMRFLPFRFFPEYGKPICFGSCRGDYPTHKSDGTFYANGTAASIAVIGDDTDLFEVPLLSIQKSNIREGNDNRLELTLFKLRGKVYANQLELVQNNPNNWPDEIAPEIFVFDYPTTSGSSIVAKSRWRPSIAGTQDGHVVLGYSLDNLVTLVFATYQNG